MFAYEKWDVAIGTKIYSWIVCITFYTVRFVLSSLISSEKRGLSLHTTSVFFSFFFYKCQSFSDDNVKYKKQNKEKSGCLAVSTKSKLQSLRLRIIIHFTVYFYNFVSKYLVKWNPSLTWMLINNVDGFHFVFKWNLILSDHISFFIINYNYWVKYVYYWLM